PCHATTGSDDLAGDLEARKVGGAWWWRIPPLALNHVRSIDPCGRDPDQHLTLAWHGDRPLLEGEDFGPAGFPDGHRMHDGGQGHAPSIPPHLRMMEGVSLPWLSHLSDLRGSLAPLLRLATPVIAAELGWMSMGIVDTLMVSPLGPAALGAVGIGSMLFMAVGIFGMGLLLGLDTMVS